MRNSVLILLLLFISTGFAQKKGSHAEIKVKHESIKEAKLLSDAIKDIPSDCKVLSWEVFVVVKGSEKSVTLEGGLLPAWLKEGYMGTGNKLFVERIRSECEKKHKSKYKIIIE